jgi:S-formylglutathione hydrolase FrmB
MRRLVRASLGLAIVVLAFGSFPGTPGLRATADAPDMVSGSGITVTAWRWIAGRTLEVDITTAKVAASAVHGPHRVRITLPNDYFTSGTTRYPVLYLLHGGAGGNSAQWTTGGGDVEGITNGRGIITVMPDGGKVGWYTNWVSQTGGAQAWRMFHIDQLIPWIDANLRTIASKSGRAIAGLSMGGFGAIRYAQDRPDLFVYAGSFSGAVDLNDYGTRSVIGQQASQNGYSPSAPFGNPFPPFDSGYRSLDPVTRASRLSGVNVGLYAGGGINDSDVLEGTMRASGERLHNAMNAAGIPHFWWMYGRPGPSAPYGCDGGHNFGCWNFAFLDAMPRMLSVLQGPSAPPPPPPSDPVVNGGFEGTSLAPWACTGNCGLDRNVGLARTGVGDGWVRNTSGWNDVHQTITVSSNRSYTITGWIRTSTNNGDGYFGLRTIGGQVIGEQRFGRLDGYTQLSVAVNSGANTSLVAYGGLWADGDTWLQIDDVSASAL